jgi:hypothetical protein
MDAKPTKPTKATGSMAKLYDRATSTILDAIEPDPSPTERPWVGGAVYAPGAARFDGGARALSEDEMRRAAPSIFAARPHVSRSERFRAIPTIEVLRGLEQEGFVAVGARQSASRDASKTDYTRHMIRLRRLDNAQKYRVGDAVCEIILRNANDGTSAYELMAGLFRIRCLNSLVARIATIDSIKVRHSGDALQKVIDGTYRVLGQVDAVVAAPQDWSRIALDCDARAALAASAHALRFGDAEGKVATPIRPEQLLTPRRADDHGPTRTLAPRPRGDDARGQQHRPGREGQQGAVESWRAHGGPAQARRVAALCCRVQRDDESVIASPSIGRQHGTQQRVSFFCGAPSATSRALTTMTIMRAAED